MVKWKSISNEPNDPSVRKFIKETLIKARCGRIDSPEDFIKGFVKDQTVLDVGVIGHTIDRSYGQDWKHDTMKSLASRIVGIDIIEEAVSSLQARGYDVRHVDATSDVDLGERFSRIVIGDVIEHVDNPVGLLKFAARHLLPGGRILCTTPNPFFVDNIISTFRNSVSVVNADHVTWITPSMALELASRAGIKLCCYWHIQGKGITLTRKLASRVLLMFGLLDNELFAGSFCYQFEHDS